MVLLYFVLVILGWLSIYAAVYNEEYQSILDTSQKYGKQMLWIITSVVLILFIFIFDGKFFSKYTKPVYIVSILSLILVLIIGKKIGGARSWFAIGNFTLQPSEFAKTATLLLLSSYLSQFNASLSKWSVKIKAMLIIAAPALLILLQPDAGSTLVYMALILVLYREGLSGNYLVIGISAVVLFLLCVLFPNWLGALVWLLASAAYYYFQKNKKRILRTSILILLSGFAYIASVSFIYNSVLLPHQKDRIDIILGKIHDDYGVGYNLNQSTIAIGSGGFLGKGFLEGTQTKLKFVPEQSTDFIFCTVGEEWGFAGSLLVVALFVALLMRIVHVAERQRSAFSRIYGYGVASILFLHFFVNIAMTIGLMPVIGIPLPFFSYGGSSLWGFTILLFIFIRLDAYRMEEL